MAIGFGIPAPKPEPRKKLSARKDREKDAHVGRVRKQVFAAHDDLCVVCHWPAESMHEITPASVVGDRVKATTVDNSVPVCGSGTTGCHGLLQQHIVRPMDTDRFNLRFVVDVESSTHPEVRALMDRYAEWRRSKWKEHI
jgi:hypothetical protein